MRSKRSPIGRSEIRDTASPSRMSLRSIQGTRYSSLSAISAIFNRCRSNPVFNALLPWIGTDSRTTLPALP